MRDLKVLLVDDDMAFRSSMERYLKAQGCTHIRVAGSGEDAIELIKQETPRVVLLDLYLPFMNGLKALSEIRKFDENIKVYMLTCEEDEEYRRLASKFGAVDYLTKPIDLETLCSRLDADCKS